MEEWACSISFSSSSSSSAGLCWEEIWPSNRGRETKIWTIKSDHKKHQELGRRGRREGSVRCSVCGPRTSEFVAGWERERVLPGPGEGWDKVWRKREVCTIKGMFAFACAGKWATETLFYVERKQANTGMFGPLWGDYRVICKYIVQPTQQCTAFQSNIESFLVREDSLKCLHASYSVCHNNAVQDDSAMWHSLWYFQNKTCKWQ